MYNDYDNNEFEKNNFENNNYENNRYDIESIGTNSDFKKPKKKNKFLVYLSLVLTTSIITSAVVGGVMYSSFSSKLDKVASIAQSSIQSSVSKEGDSSSADASILSNDTSTDTVVTAALSKNSSVVDIAKKVKPSIVGIRMTYSSKQYSYFGGSGTSESEGSGIIISKDGYIMTNYHVVQYADTKSGVADNTVLEVFLSDGREAEAKFIGGDSENDLAVIKIDLKNLTAAELGDSSKIQVGDLAVAIGNPLGIEFAGSVTAGVISAMNRTIETGDATLNAIQTDAAINAGNSGGALLNSQGQVIGINSAKISVAGVEGLGFAIPINDAKPIVEQLIKYGYVKGRPLLGINGIDITEAMSQRYDLPVGIYVDSVTTGSGAANAGIQRGDVLTKIDGTKVTTSSELDAVKKKHKAGDTVTVVIVRDGQEISIKPVIQ